MIQMYGKIFYFFLKNCICRKACMGHLLVAEKIERAILFNLRASTNPLFCTQVTCIIKKKQEIYFFKIFLLLLLQRYILQCSEQELL